MANSSASTIHTLRSTTVRTLIIVAREPQPGTTKTRLCPPLDSQTAAALYACFLDDTLTVARQVEGIQPVIAYAPETAAAYFQRLAPDLPAHAQQGKNLGERLDHALQLALGSSDPTNIPQKCTAIAMGSDSPDLPVDYLRMAFDRLDQGADVVLGPTSDGGYYLIGLHTPQPRLLRDVPMSTPTVLNDTLALADALKLQVALVPEWYDIDTIADLRRLQATLPTADATVAAATRAFFANEATRLKFPNWGAFPSAVSYP